MIFECINSIKEEIIEFDEEAESIEYLRASSNISAEANGSVNISRVLKWKGYALWSATNWGLDTSTCEM